jgi:hypothetical protein
MLSYKKHLDQDERDLSLLDKISILSSYLLVNELALDFKF